MTDVKILRSEFLDTCCKPRDFCPSVSGEPQGSARQAERAEEPAERLQRGDQRGSCGEVSTDQRRQQHAAAGSGTGTQSQQV